MHRPLDSVYASLLAGRRDQGRLRKLVPRASELRDFSSNDYLSFSTDPVIQEAYLKRLQDAFAQNQLLLGSGGSRLLDGNSFYVEAVEQQIVSFHRGPAGLLFNSGFEANTGLFGCASQKGDVIIYDELIHASVHDGMRLSRAGALLPFKHNKVWMTPHAADSEGTRSLEETLRQLVENTQDGGRFIEGTSRVFVAVESVYSMDGDVCPLREVVQCVEKMLPLGNGHIIVDEAHSTGWMGDQGRGLVALLKLEDRVWARVHTFGKAIGCSGAIVLCSPTTREYLINYARSVIYTTAMGYPSLAAVQTVYDHLESCTAQPAITHLYHLMSHTHDLFICLINRHRLPRHLFYVNERLPDSPIIPIYTSKARSLATYVQGRGFMVRAILAPTVPVGTDRVRVCLHAGNTLREVDLLSEAISAWMDLQQMASEVTRMNVSSSKPEIMSKI